MIELDFTKTLDGSKGKFALKVSLKLEEGKFFSIFGKSGAGKTTILRILSGLENPDKGKIAIGGRVYFDSYNRINLPVQQRKIGFVFQNYALFPHLNVYENIVFGCRGDKTRIQEVIFLMELEGLCKKKIDSLSGGQAQRVALARALVSSPEILLLDEPLSALDGEMRAKLQEELKHLSRHFGMTTFLVSHDLGEVFRLSDRVICLQNGEIVKIGTPDEVFLNERFSAKLQINGEILKITKNSLVFIVDILINGSVIKIVLDPNEAAGFKVGDSVAVVAKAFNPSIVLL
ncbi:molybdenum ABC transporter ATP-binding protein [Helicobacter sp. 12S02232-10]|uniref:ABC transporter ATP-binding protein n=1 Tax=Helicobacter sp. 12S02232-10 TaxID=1476197 RepID=UPI000BA69254|nr:ATP-binding cassette domain-containing protein [Helicobacter sp. 12S02232-10]PAF47948.1 molybdenum ABC transporter ATP-binding protein [Helicobacter sp. 12S02232-10]